MLSKSDCIKNGCYPVCSSDTSNNGIIGYCNNPEFIVDNENPVFVIFGDHTRTLNIMQQSFAVIDNTKVLCPKIHDINALLYITTVWRKQIKNLGYARHWKIAKNCKLSLPILLDNSKNPIIDKKKEYHSEGFIPDTIYMEKYIRKLEEKRISELGKERENEINAYLKVSGLEDYSLTQTEKEVIEKFKFNHIKTRKFKLGEGKDRLFDITSTKKKFNANCIKFGGKYPYVVRSNINNGIRGYITEDEKYLNSANTISFGQDTATIFYQQQPYFTGDKIKIMTYREKDLDKNLACYLITLMKKVFYNFSWGQSSFNETILKNIEIEMPITLNGNIDYDFIETFINAQQKLVIKNVVEWKDKEINCAKKIII